MDLALVERGQRSADWPAYSTEGPKLEGAKPGDQSQDNGMSAIRRKVSYSGQGGIRRGLYSSLTAYGNADAELSAASY